MEKLTSISLMETAYIFTTITYNRNNWISFPNRFLAISRNERYTLNNERTRSDYRSSTISVISNFRRSRSSVLSFFFSPLCRSRAFQLAFALTLPIDVLANERNHSRRKCERTCNARKTSRNCGDAATGQVVSCTRFSAWRNVKNRTKVVRQWGLFPRRAPENGPEVRSNRRVVRIDDHRRISAESTTIRRACVSREGKADATRRRADWSEFSKAIERGLFAVVTVSSIEITNSSETNGFGRRWPFRPIIAVEND